MNRTKTDSHTQGHHGAVVIITNADRTRFVVQEKDDSYTAHPNGISLFGGSLEREESPREAMGRELVEETHQTVCPAVTGALQELWTQEVPCGGIAYTLTVFESVVSESEITRIVAAPVGEGRCARELARTAFVDVDWVWGLEVVAQRYLAGHKWE